MSDITLAKASCLPQFKQRNVRMYLRVSSPTNAPELGRFLFYCSIEMLAKFCFPIFETKQQSSQVSWCFFKREYFLA